MPSVLDDLRRDTTAHVLGLSRDARLALAFALGEDDLELFARARGLPLDEALRRLQANRGVGRAPSVANVPRS
ncbi:MAG: hypothetical protein ABIT71_19150 [Vicinamibacteraceae bacterium]